MLMPFDDIEIFGIGEVETDSGVRAVFTSFEDSVHQYSRAKAQRSDGARKQVIRNKQKDIRTENKENIEATISEDLADGHSAKLDASLKLLSEDDVKLLLPNDELEDDEIHIIQTTLPHGNSALQDYQMQLMLLEQQNKKRLLAVREEQDLFGQDTEDQEEGFTQSDSLAPSEDERQNERQDIYKEQLRLTAADDSTSEREASQTRRTMPNAGARKDAASVAKKLKRNSRSNTQPDHQVYAETANGKGSKKNDAGPFEATPPHSELLYTVSCQHNSSRIHPVSVFRDLPVPDAQRDTNISSVLRQSHTHLNGRIPVFDIEALMEDSSDDNAFIIVRTVECSEASVLMVRAGGLLRWTENIYMKSQVLKMALQQIATCYFQPIPKTEGDDYYPPQKPKNSASNTPLSENQIFPADLFLFHHRRALEEYIASNAGASQHLGAILDYTTSRFGSKFAEADNLFTKGLVTQACILHLFKPNDLVISGTYGRPAAFVLQEWPEMDGDGWVTLQCWSLQTDGTGFARKSSVISLPPLGGSPKKIEDLIAYPLSFAAPELREMIRSRGEKHWQHRMATQITYKGWNVRRDQFFPDARFMIDHNTYHKMHEFAKAFHFNKPSKTFPYDRLPAYLDVEQEPSETAFFLMPPDIHGFYLNEKKWIQLFIDSVHPVTWNKKAFERLVLPPPTKDLVRALVTVRTSQRGVMQGLGVAGKRTDITSGKGNGLIMLLHGGPGTGKTLTGESVAEIAEMPLYRVTCGDIGTNAEAVERYLNTVLHLGKIWNCVLLLDEADIFLEERSMADLKRNSIVSVFLRILEYYDGILILTSNRVGMFDEAFKSRIQVALHYEKLNRSARRRIWQNFLDMLEEDEENVNFEGIKLRLDDLTERDLNGRQIRNILTTARQLAIYRNERLDWEHLEQALSVSADFHKYLQRLQGHTDEQRATDIGLR